MAARKLRTYFATQIYQLWTLLAYAVLSVILNNDILSQFPIFIL